MTPRKLDSTYLLLLILAQLFIPADHCPCLGNPGDCWAPSRSATTTTTTTASTTTQDTGTCITGTFGLTPTHISCMNYSSLFSSQVAVNQTAILEIHNSVRRGLSNPTPNPALGDLQWNDDLAIMAAHYAAQCLTVTFNPAQHVVPSMGWTYVFSSGAIQMMSNETLDSVLQTFVGTAAANYVYGVGGTNPFILNMEWYIQIIWSTTTHVGCAQIVCDVGGGTLATGYVCEYGPGGNTYPNNPGRPYPSDVVFTTPNQSQPPVTVAPTTGSACGHSQYYNFDAANPGSGIGGGVTASPNEYPWTVRLVMASGSYKTCAGVIISSTHILTKGSCVDGLDPSYVTVVFGDYDPTVVEANEFTRTASNITMYPSRSQYNNFFSDDIAIVEVSPSVSFYSNWNVQRICLPTNCSAQCQHGQIGYIAGWGTLGQNGATPSHMQSAYVEMVGHTQCAAGYQQLFGQVELVAMSNICAGWKAGGVGICSGDDGGPLMAMYDGKYVLCGVAQAYYNIDCTAPFHPGLFVSTCDDGVSSWIASTIAP